MELRVLRYFLAVAREGSITAAAQHLHITQPTLSKQLMDLEAELGKQLFLRGSRKIILTEEGKFLRKRAQEIVDLADKTQAAFQDEDDFIGGEVHIGGGETDAMRLIAQTAKDLQRDYPNIHYHLFSGNAEDVTERLDKGLLDFGILVGTADIEKYDHLPLPSTDVWGLLMRKDSPLAAKSVVTPQDLQGLPLLGSRQAVLRNELSGWYGSDFTELNMVATYNLIYNAALMVDEGFGYALCLDKLINTRGVNHLCFRPFAPRLEAQLVLVWKKYQYFSKAAETFLQRLQMRIAAMR